MLVCCMGLKGDEHDYMYVRKACNIALHVIVTDRGLGFQVSYGPGPCSRKTERAKRARSSCCTDQVRN